MIYTVWKFHNYPATDILREINFIESRNAKTAIFAVLEALNFANLVNCSLEKEQKFIKF